MFSSGDTSSSVRAPSEMSEPATDSSSAARGSGGALGARPDRYSLRCASRAAARSECRRALLLAVASSRVRSCNCFCNCDRSSASRRLCASSSARSVSERRCAMASRPSAFSRATRSSLFCASTSCTCFLASGERPSLERSVSCSRNADAPSRAAAPPPSAGGWALPLLAAGVARTSARARSRSSGDTPVSPTSVATRFSRHCTSCRACPASACARCTCRLAASRSPCAEASRESLVAWASAAICALSSASLTLVRSRFTSASRCSTCCLRTESSPASASEKTCDRIRSFSRSRSAFSARSLSTSSAASSPSSVASCSRCASCRSRVLSLRSSRMTRFISLSWESTFSWLDRTAPKRASRWSYLCERRVSCAVRSLTVRRSSSTCSVSCTPVAPPSPIAAVAPAAPLRGAAAALSRSSSSSASFSRTSRISAATWSPSPSGMAVLAASAATAAAAA
mmetsp:Transcript_11345/g.37513  ORF Transcript_11345/g.37513 Transcript_11345/m.37513 type:complete len:456 (+) Transcript_11345:2633-4000(+)